MFQETQVLKLDDLLIPDTNKVILMDVEFFEYNVLSGALKLLDEPKKTKWIIELALLAISHPKRTKWINELVLLAISHQKWITELVLLAI